MGAGKKAMKCNGGHKSVTVLYTSIQKCNGCTAICGVGGEKECTS